jgi:hypothetical protein
MKDLSNITIVGFSGSTPEQAVRSIKYSTSKINFNKKIIFSHIKPKNLTDDIHFECIEELTHHTYSRFILHDLVKYIDTDFCLITHDDGFIINPHLWDDSFLDYDYIGAPWRSHYPQARVGNGGFSLRSKKFLQLCKHIPWNGMHEDAQCCIFYKDFFIANGCKYATIDVAMRFSLESKIPECKNYSLDTTFGFHGKGLVYDVFQDDGQQFQDKINLLNTIQ